MKKLGPFVVDADSCTVERDGSNRKVTPRSMDVLLYLAEHSDRIVSSNELLDAFWSPVASDHAVHKAIAELRYAMGDNGRYQRVIKTIPKRGYKLLLLPGSPEKVQDNGKLAGFVEVLLHEFKYTDYKSLGIGLCAALVLSCLLLLATIVEPQPDTRRSFVLAVYPFQLQAEDQQTVSLFALNLYSNLVTTLSRQEQLLIIPVGGYESQNSELSRQSGAGVGSSDYQVRGVIVQTERQIQLFLSLVRSSSGIVEYSERLTIEPSALKEVPDELIDRLANIVASHLHETHNSNLANARIRY